MPLTIDDATVLQYATQCWRRRLGPLVPAEIGEVDALLEFLPLTPESMRPLLLDRAWCLLACVVQNAPRPAPCGFAQMI